MHRNDNGRDSFYAVLEKERFIGLVYTITKGNLVYIFFLAVAEDERNKGYGSKILDEIRERNKGKTIILAVEDTEDTNADNFKERIRRLEFYGRNGFERLYIKINEAGVVYELLGTETTVTQADFLRLMKDWLGGFLFKIIYRKMNLDKEGHLYEGFRKR